MPNYVQISHIDDFKLALRYRHPTRNVRCRKFVWHREECVKRSNQVKMARYILDEWPNRIH
jgi:hypothetical protein